MSGWEGKPYVWVCEADVCTQPSRDIGPERPRMADALEQRLRQQPRVAF